jgi:protein O-mannosyl-transferase
MPKRRTQPSRRPAWSGWLAIAAVALACAAYLNALDNPFVYDDHDTVTGNRSLADLSNLRFILVYTPFRPLVNASYALDRWLWDYRPFGYHLTNIMLHAAVVVLLYAWIRRLLSDAGREEDSRMPAFAGAAFFAVHPLQSEAVGYISGRSEVMCAVWFIGTLLAARAAILSRSLVQGTLAVACALLALASKETALVLPLVFLAYDWLIRPGPDDSRRKRLALIAGVLTLFAVAAFYRASTLTRSTGGLSAALLNFQTQAIVIWRYVGLLVWPAGQSIMHSVHRVVSAADPLAWVAIIGLGLVTIAAIRMRGSHPALAFGMLWFLIVLAPSSSVVPLREGMAEHRVYLASAGFFIAVAAGLQAWRGRVRQSWRPGLATATVVVVLCGLTMGRNRVWSDPVALWSEATLHAEGMWEPHYALADSMREAGQCAAAVSEYERVVSMRPEHRDARTNLGICLAQTGRTQEAERAFRRALEIDPSFARGYTNLGALALIVGDPVRARDAYLEAIVKDPDNVLARMQLASLYETTFHDYHAAARMCGEARLLAPATPGVVECVERNQRLAAGGGR